MTEQSWIFATDLHGDHQDYVATEKLFEFMEIFKPKHRIFGGDLFDFRAIRRQASKAEKADSMALDLECGLEFLKKFKPTVFLRGNHDERLWDTANIADDGLVRDHARDGVRMITNRVKMMKCKMYPYSATDGVHTLGKLTFIHGFHSGIYATKKHAEVYAPEGGMVLHGHTHAIQTASIARRGGARGMGVGCLANLDMDYNRNQTGRLIHAHGWAYGIVYKGGYEAFQASVGADKKWAVAEKILRI